jgi:hypothetical protein
MKPRQIVTGLSLVIGLAVAIAPLIADEYTSLPNSNQLNIGGDFSKLSTFYADDDDKQKTKKIKIDKDFSWTGTIGTEEDSGPAVNLQFADKQKILELRLPGSEFEDVVLRWRTTATKTPGKDIEIGYWHDPLVNLNEESIEQGLIEKFDDEARQRSEVQRQFYSTGWKQHVFRYPGVLEDASFVYHLVYFGNIPLLIVRKNDTLSGIGNFDARVTEHNYIQRIVVPGYELAFLHVNGKNGYFNWVFINSGPAKKYDPIAIYKEVEATRSSADDDS